MIDTSSPGTIGWWLKRLIEKLAANSTGFSYLDSYYRNENGIPATADQNVKESYRRLMSVARTNFAELVVEAVRERMMPVGFRTGATDDRLGDSEAWRIWQANALDADSAIEHRNHLTMGLGFTIVGPIDPDIEAPLITIEDPREVVVETDPRRRRKITAALKVFRDDTTSTDWAYLYLPGLVVKAARAATHDRMALDLTGWEWDSVQRLGFPVVPVVPFVNRANASGVGTGEFETHLSVLDRINFQVLQSLEISTMQAYRQRAIKGVPRTDEQGNEVDYDDIFAAGPGRMWHLPSTAELWESGQVDLGPVRSTIRDSVQDLAASTRTPLFYLTPDAANGSAEGASLAREGLVFKTYDRLGETGESWEQTMAYAFLFSGDEVRARRRDMEIIWAPPERYSLSVQADAAAKAMKGGLSLSATLETVWRKTPQEIRQIKQDLAEESLLDQGAALAALMGTGGTGPDRQPETG